MKLGFYGRWIFRRLFLRPHSGRESEVDFFLDVPDGFLDGQTDLFHRVAVADGHRAVLQGLKIDGEAVGGADFVLAAVA